MENGVRFRFIGNTRLLNEEIRRLLKDIEEKTKDCYNFMFNLALSYRSRDEMTRAIKKIMKGVEEGAIKQEDVSEKLVNDYLYVKTPVDVLVRTSGEVHFSDFLLWQSTTAQLCFTEKLWPDFNFWEFIKLIFKYQRSNRNFMKYISH